MTTEVDKVIIQSYNDVHALCKADLEEATESLNTEDVYDRR